MLPILSPHHNSVPADPAFAGPPLDLSHLQILGDAALRCIPTALSRGRVAGGWSVVTPP
jgi:hypothetical protein